MYWACPGAPVTGANYFPLLIKDYRSKYSAEKKSENDTVETDHLNNELLANLMSVVIVRGSPVSNDTVEHSYRIFLPQLT